MPLFIFFASFIIFHRRIYTLYFIISKGMKQQHMYRVIKSLNNQSRDDINNRQIDHSAYNIFTNKNKSFDIELNINKIKPYQIVGYQEIKGYQKILNKQHKLSHNKPISLQTSKSFAGNAIIQNKEYYKKSQVFQKLPILNKQPKNYKIFLDSKRVNPSIWVQKENNYNLSSIKKLKSKYNEYKQHWNLFFSDRQKQNKKGNTLHEAINTFRLKIEEKDKLQVCEVSNLNKRNIQWMNSLRNSAHINNEAKVKDHMTINKDGLELKGFSKLHVETQWIEQKDEAGYEFKFLEQSFKENNQKNNQQ